MTEGTDPRASVPQDVRPVVAGRGGNGGIWAFAILASVSALLLFSTIDNRRRALTAPATRVSASDVAAAPSVPPLYVPPAPVVVRSVPVVAAPAPVPSPLARATQTPPPAPAPPAPPGYARTETPPRAAEPCQTGPVLVYDGSPGEAASTVNAAPGTSAVAVAVAGAGGSTRARAARLAGQKTTVPQGTLIPAVLETALDSTRPGQARALVSRDVRGFDGSRILIPRGSRLYGEYRADLAPGQNRALVQWTRLVRPDGVTIAIDSPAADALGRAGIRGKVDSHFLERFGGALLQSSLDLGVALATQSAGNGSLLVLPRGGQAIGGGSQQVRPTLTVRQGARVTVFVARDLDFNSVDGR